MVFVWVVQSQPCLNPNADVTHECDAVWLEYFQGGFTCSITDWNTSKKTVQPSFKLWCACAMICKHLDRFPMVLKHVESIPVSITVCWTFLTWLETQNLFRCCRRYCKIRVCQDCKAVRSSVVKSSTFVEVGDKL